MSNEKYSVEREYNYRITIKDGVGKSLQFRDITGKDLEYLERFFKEERGEMTIDDAVQVLEHVSMNQVPLTKLTPRVIKDIFGIVSKEIFCNFMPKFKFLEVCYYLQNNSFVALDFFESQPMTKVMAMVQVHQQEIEKINKDRSSK